MKPIVSVCMLTYNHQSYIREAIESVLKQITDFPIELVIGEDYSSDSTRAICEEYGNKFPYKVKLLPHNNRNIGAQKNFIRTFRNCSGTYVAMLEGDDFWLDPLKLQKQVSFLDNNPEYVMSFHGITMINDEGEPVNDNRLPDANKRDYNVNELLLGQYLPTPTILFRNFCISTYLTAFEKTLNGDKLLQAILTQRGKAKYFDNIDKSCIRIHNGGIWTSKSYLDKWCWNLKTALTIYGLLNNELKKYIFNNVVNAFEMAAWDADYYKAEKYWRKYNFMYFFFLMQTKEYGRAFLILRRLSRRVLRNVHISNYSCLQR
ncbi:glycosyltransferase family 2 protein [Pontibacter liquoris]|uniref:glycosyltransferase family 2 protein n=1 Tax=Pontibacter liquoris TaxID=2905677 RepID=UPI001FA812A0|nr:glycosyltransferase [Pontibacter liquoris]